MAAKKKTPVKEKNFLRPWERGGPSPNPKGRPRGIKDKRTQISQKLLQATDEIADKVIAEANAGDMQAAALIFGRVLPALSSRDLPVKFDLDPTASLTEQTQQVLNAVAKGDVPPDVAKKILDCVATLGTVRHMEHFEERLKQLEEQTT